MGHDVLPWIHLGRIDTVLQPFTVDIDVGLLLAYSSQYILFQCVFVTWIYLEHFGQLILTQILHFL